VVNTPRTVGLALGIAIMGIVVAADGPIDTATTAGRQAFAAGITAGLRLDTVLAVIAMVIAVLFIRTPGRPAAHAAEADRDRQAAVIP
jgi:hypothetical protein